MVKYKKVLKEAKKKIVLSVRLINVFIKVEPFHKIKKTITNQYPRSSHNNDVLNSD